MQGDRETLKIVVVGHVDHGKSTVIGRLLYDTKSLPEGTVEKVMRISKEKGKPFEYAYLLDAFEEEQKQGITIDTTQLQFHTADRDYIIIDAPGHKEFLKNMISGAASAEAALLIIDANEGIQEQSKRHGYILSLLGIQKVYVLVNKMDLIGYSEEKFNEIKRDMNEFLNNLHVYPLKYIPISAFYGENITSHSEQMTWYKGEPVLRAIDQFEKEQGLENKALRFPIQDVYKFDHRRIVAGRIEAGSLQAGDEIIILPGGKMTRVKSIEHWGEGGATSYVSAGMSVGITLEDEFFNQRGEIIAHPQDIPLVSDCFKASLFWMGKNELVKQKEYKLKLVTQEIEGEILTISKVIDATTLETTENAGSIKTNDVAEVIIRTKKSICFDEFKNNQNTGRFVIVDGYDVCGGGIVSGPVKGLQGVSKFSKGNISMTVSCFDEYYYVLAEDTIRKVKARPHTFSIGDAVPVSGETYEYPDSFDVLDIQKRLIAKVRKSRLESLTKFNDYSYSTIPIIDSKGAFIRVESKEEFVKFTTDFVRLSTANEQVAAFSRKWLEFAKFRHIQYIDEMKSLALEYEI